MNDTHIRVRANRSTGDLEIEGPSEMVKEWWKQLWPTLSEAVPTAATAARSARAVVASNLDMPDVFGEFYHEFRSDITDVDRVLIAAAFVQGNDAERTFTTKSANQALLDQNVKVANASQAVRRLVGMKRAFPVSDGIFRVSSTGFEHLALLKGESLK